MPDIRTLLHDAVPLDAGGPDLARVTRKVSARRRHRRRGRGVAGLVVLGLGAAGVAVAVTGPDRDRVETAASSTAPGSPDRPEADELVRLLATRGWLATAHFTSWPVTPEDFAAGPGRADVVVSGTLVEVRPGEITSDVCLDDPTIGGCLHDAAFETVIQVDRVVGEGIEPGTSLAVPWTIAKLGHRPGPDAEAASALLTGPYQAAAPLGARVLVFLVRSDGDGYPWRPIEPSGIVFEDPGGGAIVPGPEAPVSRQPYSLDDYLQAAETQMTGDGAG